jgi:hypothetical protein
LVFLVGVLSSCSTKPIVETQVVEKPMPVYCNVPIPAECKDAYAVDRVSPADDPLTINRAMRIEIEERASCEIRMRAAIKGCGKQP